MKTIRNRQEWDSTRWDSSPPGPVTGVLVGPPLYFDITDVRNEHMKGQIGNVDKRRAQDKEKPHQTNLCSWWGLRNFNWIEIFAEVHLPSSS